MNIRIKLDKDNPKFQFLILILICLFTIFFIVIFGKLFIHPFLEPIYSDDKKYIKMAKNISEPAAAPFAYRILTPLLVYLLPINFLSGFIIINLSSLFATSILFFYYLRKLEFNFGVSLIGVLFFLLNPITIFLIFAICLVDLLLFFFFLLAFYAILQKNDLLFMLSITIGVANKETILITLILFFICKLEDKELSSAVKSTILISLPPITIFLIIRFFYGFDPNYFSLSTIFNVLSKNLSNFQTSIFILPYIIYLPFGILWLISLLNLKKINNSSLKKSLYLIPFIFLQILIATNPSRLFFIAFPIIIPISLYMFKEEGFPKKTLMLLIIFAIILLTAHILGLLIYFKLNPYASLMAPESYLYWFLLGVLFEIFSILILFYLLLKSTFFQGKDYKMK